jgi:phage shock protein PspC (stress-responsive transcriptional regulator)
MSSSQPFARNDTILGVCQSLGDDLGFNPIYLRVLFGASLIWNPLAVIAAYVGLAVVIAFSNWLFPSPRVEAEDAAEVGQSAPVRCGPNRTLEPMAAAA